MIALDPTWGTEEASPDARMSEQSSPLAPDSSTSVIAVFQVSRLIERWRAAFDIDVSEELAGLREIVLHRCEASQLDFFVPASAEGSSHLYEQLARFDWFYMSEKWEFDQGIRDLRGCERILEVGSGPGSFLEKVRDQSGASVVRGTETNRTLVARAAERGLEVETVELDALIDRGEMYDAVCSFQVLEHLADPRRLLTGMVRLLAPGGRLIICVPNRCSFLKHQFNLLDMPPHHMTRWSSFTLRYLERLFPLRLARLRVEPLAPYHARGYVTTYASYLGQRLPVLANLLSESRALKIARMLEITPLRRLLRGQSLYALFEKV